MEQPLYRQIASLLLAIENCERAGNAEWKARHGETIRALVREHMPSGSGFDNGTTLEFERSRPDRLVFLTAFHHMDEVGGYAGWSDHTVIVTPSLAFPFDLRATGRDRNGIKDYIAETFKIALQTVVDS